MRGPHGHGRAARALAAVLALTLTLTVFEAVGGFLTGSLALLADAGHMLADAGALALALLAVWIAGKPPTPERSFGYRRAEILAALANGVALVAIAIWIFVEAVRRLSDSPEILGGSMLAIAAVGLAGNAVAAAVLVRTGADGLNLRAALDDLHIWTSRSGASAS